MRFILETPVGVEDIVKKEVREKIGRVKFIPFNFRGHVVFESKIKKYEKLFSLRSIHNAGILLDFFLMRKPEISEIRKKLERIDFSIINEFGKFRASTSRYGKHNFKSIDVSRVVGEIVHERYKAEVDLENYDVIVKTKIIGRYCIVSLVLKNFLNRRDYFVFNHPAMIDAALAYSMVRLVKPKKRNVLLDPMCGSGTIPIEAAIEYKNKIKIAGMDVSRMFIEGAKKNARAASVSDFIEFKVGDCRELDKYFSSVDRIVSNPPYGIKFGNEGYLRSLYFKFLESTSKIMDFRSRIVIATIRAGMFRNLLMKQRDFRIVEERIVSYGGFYPNLFIIERI